MPVPPVKTGRSLGSNKEVRVPVKLSLLRKARGADTDSMECAVPPDRFGTIGRPSDRKGR